MTASPASTSKRSDVVAVRDHIAALRAAGLGQKAIAREAKISRVAIEKIESGRTSRPYRTTAERLLAVPVPVPEPGAVPPPATTYRAGHKLDLVPIGPIREHMKRLRQRGMTVATIEHLAGVPASALKSVYGVSAKHISKSTAQKLLGVVPADMGDLDAHVADADTVRAHLLMLRRTGATYRKIAAATGISRVTITSIMQGRQRHVSVSVARRLFSLDPHRMGAARSKPAEAPCLHPGAPHLHGTYDAHRYDGCRCVPCTGAASARMRYSRSSHKDLVPVGSARAHVEHLLAAGFKAYEIQNAAGVSQGVVARTAELDVIKADNAEKLLAVSVESLQQKRDARVKRPVWRPSSVDGAERVRPHLAQLREAGMSWDEIERAAGMAFRTRKRIVSDESHPIGEDVMRRVLAMECPFRSRPGARPFPLR